MKSPPLTGLRIGAYNTGLLSASILGGLAERYRAFRLLFFGGFITIGGMLAVLPLNLGVDSLDTDCFADWYWHSGKHNRRHPVYCRLRAAGGMGSENWLAPELQWCRPVSGAAAGGRLRQPVCHIRSLGRCGILRYSP